MNCLSCHRELHETDNILDQWCDPDCAEKGEECPICGLVPHRCQCSEEELQELSGIFARTGIEFLDLES